MRIVKAIAAAALASLFSQAQPQPALGNYTSRVTVKTGTQKYFGPGKRLPPYLIGYRRSLRRSARILEGKYTLR